MQCNSNPLYVNSISQFPFKVSTCKSLDFELQYNVLGSRYKAMENQISCLQIQLKVSKM